MASGKTSIQNYKQIGADTYVQMSQTILTFDSKHTKLHLAEKIHLSWK